MRITSTPEPGAANFYNLEIKDGRVSLQEQTISCPCCGEQISLLLDLSLLDQSYVEDCSVCCQPILLTYSSLNGELLELATRAEGGE